MAKELEEAVLVQVQIPVEEMEVKPCAKLLVYSTAPKMDLYVLVEANNLQSVFDFLSKDLEECLAGSKRSYKAKKEKP